MHDMTRMDHPRMTKQRYMQRGDSLFNECNVILSEDLHERTSIVKALVPDHNFYSTRWD